MTHRTVRKIPCGDLELTLGSRTLVMGILNVTPDSFSDGGLHDSIEKAVGYARELVEKGADIIDIGGESTRPGAEPVSLEEELERVLPVIAALKEHIRVPISVDTYKAEVARRALEAGAHIINDIWGLKKERSMAEVVAAFGCPVILMHNRDNRDYKNLLDDVKADLLESVEIARRAGIREDRIILDPGIGFAKNYEENLIVLNRLEEISALGYPVLLGTSRKRFIRTTLDLPPDDVVEGTAATVVLGIVKGCDIVRVHDVQPIKRAVLMTDVIVRGSAGKEEKVHG